MPTIFAVANRVAVLSKGKIIMYDEAEKVLRSDNPEIKNFLTAQMQKFHTKLSQLWF